ncbi:MAG: hypothetical protein A2X58_07465 [Nitrospirae bacterium GWC2_56_14]|nr:MAG: hypothetical protein A2X58_07465 [Nitrospirae bacterium GWC2_56_14]
MEDKVPGPVKGYQKQVKKEEKPIKPPKPKGNYAPSPTAQKWPVLAEAIEKGNVDVVKKLIEEGINVNIGRNGITPLMLAASKGQTELAEIFLQAGVNINATDDDGSTALHKAAVDQAGTAIIELLIHSGIDVAALNNSKKTALMLAEEAKHRDIVLLMKKDQQKLETDAREWEAFLNSPEGRPYKQKKLQDSLASISKFIWLPPVALGVAGMVLGALFHAVILTAFIGIVLGLLASLAGYVLQENTRRYLDGLEPLPYLDIHMVREKHKAGQKITVGKKSRHAIAEKPASHAPAAVAAEMHQEAVTHLAHADKPATAEVPADHAPLNDALDLHLDAAPESRPHHAPAEKPALAKKPATRPGLNLRVVAAAAGALVLVLIAGSLFLYRGPLSNWYYAKKIERAGLDFSGQAFLAEVSKNNEEAVDLFIKAGIPIDAKNKKGQTALTIAAEKGNVNMLGKLTTLDAALLSHADADGNTALMIAARQGKEESVKALIEKGAEVNYVVPAIEGAATPLQAVLDVADFSAAHMIVTNSLLQHGATVTGKNTAGRFPLLFAAEHGRTDAAALLIEKGAEVNDTDLKGNFPLLLAACKGESALVTLLLDKGANMQMALPDGQTPLMCAAREGREDTVKVLLERGAAVNAGTKDGNTALTAAARTGNVAMVKLLLEKGADPSAGFLPGPFIGLNGKAIAISAKKGKLGDVLGKIAKTASLDGYTVALASKPEQKVNVRIKGAWNKVLAEVATKNHLSLVVKDTTVFVLPYDPAAIKREVLQTTPVAAVP